MTSKRLPLFPLHTVLLPGMVLPLHIFEPRYVLMMERVLSEDRSFGVTLIREGAEVGGSAKTYDVGTIADITDVVPLGDGRMNISTTGSRRFRVERFYHDQPYLTGDVVLLSEEYRRSEKLDDLQAEVRRLSLAYVTTLLALRDEQATEVQLPGDPVTLSYKVAALLVAAHRWETQELLACPSLERRLFDEIVLLRRELAIVRHMGQMTGQKGRFSPN